jgi:hypothetical protein
MLGLVWWLGGFVVEHSGIGLVERRGSGFGVGDGLESRRCGVVGLGGESNAAAGMKGIVGINYARYRKNGCERDGVLEGEGGFGSALPEAGEKHEEEAELGE